MRRIFTTLAFTACSLWAASAAGAMADITGDTVTAHYLYPDKSTIYWDIGTATAPVTFSDVLSAFDLVITGNQVIVNWTGTNTTYPAAFDGLEIIDSTNPFTSAALDAVTNTPGELPTEVTVESGNLFIDFNGTTYGPGENVTVDLNGFAGGGSAPEPGAWVLMVLGVGAVGAMARRTRLIKAQGVLST